MDLRELPTAMLLARHQDLLRETMTYAKEITRRFAPSMGLPVTPTWVHKSEPAPDVFDPSCAKGG